jgi:hypothetical protein
MEVHFLLGQTQLPVVRLEVQVVVAAVVELLQLQVQMHK